MKSWSIAVVISALAVVLVGCSSPTPTTPTDSDSTSNQERYPVYDSLEQLAQQTSVAIEGTVTEIQVELVEAGDGPTLPPMTFTSSPTDSPSDVPTDSPSASPSASPSQNAGPTGLASASSTPVPTRAVYTIYTLRIDNCYKGCQSFGGSLQFRDLGGSVDGVSYNTPNSVKLEQDSAYVLFLRPDQTGSLVVVNPSQSVYLSPAEHGAFPSLNQANEFKLTPDQLRKLFG